jgi:glycosidase
MLTTIYDPAVLTAISQAQSGARAKRRKNVVVGQQTKSVQSPFPSPHDWRDNWIYFLLIDRFNNTGMGPKGTWNHRYDFRHGGTFKGVQAQLSYLQDLGAKAIWLSPVLKNSRPNWQYSYHGYGQQDFLNVDERFASDGQLATAERELSELVDEAHARDMFVILDIVLNHTARVFDYVRPNGVVSNFTDPAVMAGPLGIEPAVQWLNGFGFPRADWQNRLDPPNQLHPDDAIWPSDLQSHLFFRRRGSKLGDAPDARGFVPGDFGDMRQLVVEYDATQPGQEPLRAKYGISPVLSILIRAHQYLIARYDFDGFRIDTVKYVDPEAIEVFGNAMREFGLTVGKKNFFTFAEVYDNEQTIAKFTGRNGGSGEGFGVDAALDFPLFYKLPGVAKGFLDVAEIRYVFEERKRHESELLSSHGEAGRFFVSFLDNHDQKERIKHPNTPSQQVSCAIALLFTLQGIPCLYYGTEQELSGTVDGSGNPDLTANESSREALWGNPNGFAKNSTAFKMIQTLSQLREREPSLAYGRLYFREISTNGTDFGHSYGIGGLVIFSRILVDREIVVIANTGNQGLTGNVIIDRDIHASPRMMKIEYSNVGSTGTTTSRIITAANFYRDGETSTGPAAVLDVVLAAHEIQIMVPV